MAKLETTLQKTVTSERVALAIVEQILGEAIVSCGE